MVQGVHLEDKYRQKPMVGSSPTPTQQQQQQKQQQKQQQNNNNNNNNMIFGSPLQLCHQDKRIPHQGEPFEPGLQRYYCIDADIVHTKIF